MKRIARTAVALFASALSTQAPKSNVPMDYNESAVTQSRPAPVEVRSGAKVSTQINTVSEEIPIDTPHSAIELFEKAFEDGVRRRFELVPGGVSIIAESYLDTSKRDDSISINDIAVVQELELRLLSGNPDSKIFTRSLGAVRGLSREHKLEESDLIDPTTFSKDNVMGKPEYYFVVKRADLEDNITFTLGVISPSHNIDEDITTITLDKNTLHKPEILGPGVQRLSDLTEWDTNIFKSKIMEPLSREINSYYKEHILKAQ
jgi:hypothetical protein